MSASNSTIQGMIDGRYRVTAYCHNSACGHRADIDFYKLRDRLGPDHGALHDDLVPLLRCTRCGGKEVGLTVTPGSREYVNLYERGKDGR